MTPSDTNPRFDVMLYDFAHVAPDAAAERLSRVFGIPLQTAAPLVASLPRMVTRGAAITDAQRIVDALTAIGARAEIFASQSQPAPAPTPPTARRTSETVKLGTQDLEAFGLTAWPPPAHTPSTHHIRVPPSAAGSAPTPTPISIPIPAPANVQLTAAVVHRAFELDSTPGPALELASVPVPRMPSTRPIAPTHAASRVELADAPAPADAWRASLRLPPLMAAAVVPAGLRAPKQRARLPRRVAQASSTTPPARPLSQGLLDPLKLTVGILQQAKQSSWQTALRGHPAAGFLIVLGATTLAFLALYAVV